MKKKMTVLCALLALVGITSYSVSGTYAKYIADFDIADSARVAHWGFNDEEFEVDLFQTSYTSTDGKDVESVNAATDPKDRVVAPGTKGFYTFTLGDNAPETNYELTVEDNSSIDEVETKGAGQIKYYFKKVEGMTKDQLDTATWESFNFADADKKNTIALLISAISTEINGVYAANTAPSNVYVIGWEWVFEDNADSSRDINDTNLGNSFAGTNPEEINVKLNLTIHAEQSEKAPTK